MAEFATLIGTEQSSISRYEAGQLVPSKTVLILLLLLASDEGKPSIRQALGIAEAQPIESRYGAGESSTQGPRCRSETPAQSRYARAEFAEETMKIISGPPQ